MNESIPSANGVIEVFNEARARPAGPDREQFLAAACGADAKLRAEVDELLGAREEAGSFLKPGAAVSPELEAEFARLKPEEAGEMIGPYKLREQIGEGGFGTVWVADQEKPVRRRVALKIIKMGMDTKEVIARFEQERQALAMMDHPNIAKILDAGVTQYGRPFFVMELVRGVKITEYCDDQKLSTRERVGVFITVCQAVQHAHQKGIIHRDIKPSNILVTINDGKAVPKVIDFGVAKATQGRLTDATVYTQFQQMIGTPLYMSPEQAELTSLDIDTRSDIYALGVLLYELLTGHTPIEQDTLARVGMDEIRRLIREVDPPRPSMRMKTLAAAEMTTAGQRRHTDPTKLAGTLRGDIDWIVMKCLEKDRARRYDTANGLAMDLQRHLANEVVVARPPTAGYLLGKLIRRNKLAFAAGTAIAASLVIGIAASVWQAVRAQNEATRAKTAEQRSAATLDELRATAPAFAEQARGLAAKEQYADAIAKLDYAIKLRPDAAEFLVAKGDLLQCQLQLAPAAAIYRDALRVQPGLARAEAAAKLCEELLAAPPAADGKLTRESLAKLHLAMQQQQRPAAELLPVARLLGEEKKLLLDYWIARLKDLPVSAENPLAKRLTVGEDGRLALDLRGTKVTDLSRLAGAPLAALDVSQCQELTDLSPLHGIALIELNISGTSVADLTPLREMHTLEELNVAGSKVSDLPALSALRLADLDLSGTRIFDISALRGMKLRKLSLRNTRVADLSPLFGMPLTFFDTTTIPATDYTPLTGAPLEVCIIQNSPLRDLSFLRDSPVKELCLFGCNELRGYSVLAGLKRLDLLILPQIFRSLPAEELAAIGALRSHPTLKNIQTEYRSGGGWIISTTLSKDVFWQDWDREQSLVLALRAQGLQFSLNKLSTGTYRLAIQRQPLHDLSILKDAPISELVFNNCRFSDLAPIHDLKLEHLELSSDAVADLSPLRGMPLKKLVLSGQKITDLSPLKGLPLRELYLEGCRNLTNVAALSEIPTLENVTVPMQARNIEVLRQLTKLQRLGFGRDAGGLPASTVADFWKDCAPDGWLARLRDSGLKFSLNKLSTGTYRLSIQRQPLHDLSILKDAPISELVLNDCPFSDLAPIHDLKLEHLELSSDAVADLGPLQGMPLKKLFLSGPKISDLSPLKGLPLREIYLEGCINLTNVAALSEIPTLENVTVPMQARNIEVLRQLTKLQRLGFGRDARGLPASTVADFWKDWAPDGWLARLRDSGLKIKIPNRLPDGTWEVRLYGTSISDLSMLKGAPISILGLGGTKVSDLTPLRGMPLKKLLLWGTEVKDLAPLQGMGLNELNVVGTKVADISVLRGMSLTCLKLHGCKLLTDLSPLAESKDLRELTIPEQAKNFEFLRGFPKLERLGYSETQVIGENPPNRTAAEFWKEYDAAKKK